MQFCCDLKATRLFIQTFLLKMTALSLVMVLFGNIAVQTFHQHTESSAQSETNTCAKLKSAEHCSVCDHFHHHSGAAIIPEDVYLSSASVPEPLCRIALKQQAYLTFEPGSFVNKGPPTLL